MSRPGKPGLNSLVYGVYVLPVGLPHKQIRFTVLNMKPPMEYRPERDSSGLPVSRKQASGGHIDSLSIEEVREIVREAVRAEISAVRKGSGGEGVGRRIYMREYMRDRRRAKAEGLTVSEWRKRRMGVAQ